MFKSLDGPHPLEPMAGPGAWMDGVDFRPDRDHAKQMFEVFDAKTQASLPAPFVSWLQDVGSGVNESREDALRYRPPPTEGGWAGSTDYAAESALTLVARMAFLQGVHHALWFGLAKPDHAGAALSQVAMHYLLFSPYFESFASQDSRAEAVSEEVLLTQQLLNAGEAPAHYLATADTNWTQLAAQLEREENARSPFPIPRSADRFTLI
jgi:hypothetical protein